MTVAEIRAWLKSHPQHLSRVHNYLVRQGIAVESIDDNANVVWGEGVTAADKQRAVQLVGDGIQRLIDNPPDERTLEERIAQLEAQVQALLDQLGGGV